MGVSGITVRPAQEADVNYILSTWIRGYRSSPIGSLTDPQSYFDEQRAVATRLLAKNSALVAAVDGADDEIAGWICGEPLDRRVIVHYVYVKPLYRKVGVARMLLGSLGYSLGDELIATHITYIQTEPNGGKSKAEKLRAKYRITNNPFLAWRSGSEKLVRPSRRA